MPRQLTRDEEIDLLAAEIRKRRDKCPEECAGGSCPYEALDPSRAKTRAFELSRLDALHGTKRRRLSAGVSRRDYLHGFESWIRRNDKRRRRKLASASVAHVAFDIGF